MSAFARFEALVSERATAAERARAAALDAQAAAIAADQALADALDWAIDAGPGAWAAEHMQGPRCVTLFGPWELGTFEATHATEDTLTLRTPRVRLADVGVALRVEWREIFVRRSDGCEVGDPDSTQPVLSRAQIEALVAALGGP